MKFIRVMKCNQKEKNLYVSGLDKLPWDVLFHIYSFCDSGKKKKMITYLINRYDILIIIFLLMFNSGMYFLGFLITGHCLGFYLFFNILLGYLILGGLCLVLLFYYICVKIIIEMCQRQD